MKKLQLTCLLLFSVPYWGKQSFPIIFDNWYVQWSAIAIIAILLPIGFTKSLTIHLKSRRKNYKTLSDPIMFLLIFCIIVLFQMPVHYINTNLFHDLDTLSIGHDTDLLESPSSAENEKKRHNSAKFIFYEFGKKVPYLLDNGEYKIFEPSKDDVSKFNESKNIREETDFYRTQIKNTSRQVLYFQVFEITSFFLLVAFTLLFEQRRLQIKQNRS